MAVDFDASRAVRRPSDLAALVDAVYRAHPGDESDCLEWKSRLPLGTSEGNFETARHVLGFANRLPEAAAEHFEGSAYLILGAEPGNLDGQEQVDPATLESWLRPYLGGDGPAWTPHQVDVSGTNVLLLETAPPRLGDPIFTLRKEYSGRTKGTTWRAGTVFVRHMGKTETATPEDIRYLSDRVAAPGSRFVLRLETREDALIAQMVVIDDDVVRQVIEEERERLMTPLKGARRTDPGPKVFQAISAGMTVDARSHTQYEREVHTYLDRLKRAMGDAAIGRAVKTNAMPGLSLVAVNTLETNYEEVRLQLAIPEGLVALEKPDRIPPLPTPPKLYGGQPFAFPSTIDSPLAYSLPLDSSRGMEFDYDSAMVSFPTFHLRPLARVPLDPILLFARKNSAERELVVPWTATSTSSNGVAEGSIPIRVSSDVWALHDYLPKLRRD